MVGRSYPCELQLSLVPSEAVGGSEGREASEARRGSPNQRRRWPAGPDAMVDGG